VFYAHFEPELSKKRLKQIPVEAVHHQWPTSNPIHLNWGCHTVMNMSHFLLQQTSISPDQGYAIEH